MQILEVSELGLRSAVLRIKHRDSPMRFLIFPMIHMAHQEFYRDVTRLLRETDVIVVEGGAARRPLGFALTATYRILALRPSARLVSQHIDYAALGKPLIKPDVTAAEFGAAWRRSPLYKRALIWAVVIASIPVQLLMTKKALLKRIVGEEVNDLPSDQEEAMDRAAPEFAEALGGIRDRQLAAALADLHAARRHEDIVVGVVYGALHVPPIVEALRSLGYFVRSADWVTVVDLHSS